MKFKFFSGFLFLMAVTSSVFGAKDDKETLAELIIEDSANIYAIAAYPENVRQYIFEASTQPQGIANLGNIQKKSAQDFKSLLAPYTQEEQQRIWNLTRYQNLISRLAAITNPSKNGIGAILNDYPTEVYNDAMHYTLSNQSLLRNIDAQNKAFDTHFYNLVKGHSPATQAAFEELLKTPEVISLLNSDMHGTVLLGDIYRRNPELVSQRFNGLNLEIAQQKARDLEEWKQTIKSDSAGQLELQESAKEYAKENGYAADDYYNTDPMVVERYVYVPYPYWCGYPWWYSYDYWYPYPYWYHWGFYYWHNTLCWIGTPSWHFMHWHFGRHHHHYHYPHVTNVYINFYRGHRAAPRNAAIVHNWVTNNRNYFPSDFSENNKERPGRIQEYGRFENDYEKYYNENKDKAITPKEYLKVRTQDYPKLQSGAREEIKHRDESLPQPGRKDVEQKPQHDRPIVQPGRNPEPKPAYPKPVENPKVRETEKNPVPRQPQRYEPAKPQPAPQPEKHEPLRQRNEPRPLDRSVPQTPKQRQPDAKPAPAPQRQVQPRPDQQRQNVPAPKVNPRKIGG